MNNPAAVLLPRITSRSGFQCLPSFGDAQKLFSHVSSLCHRCEAEKLREENAILKSRVTLLNEEGSASSLRLRELNGSREEMR